MNVTVPFSKSETIGATVRKIYDAAYREALREYGNSTFANVQAWKAVGRAGFCQDRQTGRWFYCEYAQDPRVRMR